MPKVRRSLCAAKTAHRDHTAHKGQGFARKARYGGLGDGGGGEGDGGLGDGGGGEGDGGLGDGGGGEGGSSGGGDGVLRYTTTWEACATSRYACQEEHDEKVAQW